MDLACYKDRQLILRAFRAAGPEPSIELLELIPETLSLILNDPMSSTRDRIRAVEVIQSMQKIQLATIGMVIQIKSASDRRKLVSIEPPKVSNKPMDPEISRMLLKLESELLP